ncbi:MAG: hypothetical protein U9Q69_02035 [Nanoarchaeota archaeon]|nr:hypothetical protein [Nanoarchaeota archaeon]
MKRNKRGQSEDIFSDLIPAIVIMIIAIVILSIANSNDTLISYLNSDYLSLEKTQKTADSISTITANAYNLERISAPIALRMPFQNTTLAEFINGLKDLNNGLKDLKKEEALKLVPQGIINLQFTENGYAFKCGQGLFKNMSIMLSGYSHWLIVGADAKTNEIFFYCSDLMYKESEKGLIPNVKITGNTIDNEGIGELDVNWELDVNLNLVLSSFEQEYQDTINLWLPTKDGLENRISIFYAK